MGAILAKVAKHKTPEQGVGGCGAAVAASTRHDSDTEEALQIPKAQGLLDYGDETTSQGILESNPDGGGSALLTPEVIKFFQETVRRELASLNGVPTRRLDAHLPHIPSPAMGLIEDNGLRTQRMIGLNGLQRQVERITTAFTGLTLSGNPCKQRVVNGRRESSSTKRRRRWRLLNPP